MKMEGGMSEIEQQEARFIRAVKAMCGPVCIYPACPCTGTPSDVTKAINAWEALPEPSLKTEYCIHCDKEVSVRCDDVNCRMYFIDAALGRGGE